MAGDSFYFYGRGKVDFCTRTPAGKIESMTFVGNVPQLEVKFQTESIEHMESQTGKGFTDLRIQNKIMGNMTCVLEDFNRENLAKAYYGTATAVVGATVTSEAVIAKAGGRVPLNNVGLSAFTSLGTLVNGTDYVVDLESGVIEFLTAGAAVDGTSYAAAYVYSKYDNLSAFTAPNKDVWLRFNGLNIADEEKAVIVDLYKVNFDPAEMLSLIQTGNDIAQLTLNGNVLRDPLQPKTGPGGQFMRWRRVNPA
jgi:hypothetical protein